MPVTIPTCDQCEFDYDFAFGNYACCKCGYVLTRDDKQQALRQSNACRAEDDQNLYNNNARRI